MKYFTRKKHVFYISRHVTCSPRPPTLWQRRMDLHVWSYPRHSYRLYSRFHRNPFRGVWATYRGRNLLLPIDFAIGFYNCLHYRANCGYRVLMYKSFLKIKSSVKIPQKTISHDFDWGYPGSSSRLLSRLRSPRLVKFRLHLPKFLALCSHQCYNNYTILFA